MDRDLWLCWFVALHYADRSTDCWQTAQLNASTATVIATPLLTVHCCVVICGCSPGWQSCFIPHFHWAIKGSSVALDAAVYLLVFVIITMSQTGYQNRRRGEGGGCVTAARAGVTQVLKYCINSPFIFILNLKWRLILVTDQRPVPRVTHIWWS